jgi:nucleoid-associated protein EbfC
MTANTPSLSEIMQKAQEMQTKMQQVQRKVAALIAQGEAGGGLAKVTLNGQHEMRDLTIDPSLLKESPVVIADVIKAAHQDAKRKVDLLMQKEMTSMAKEMGLPEDVGGASGMVE